MKATELIKVLQSAVEEHGDVEIHISESESDWDYALYYIPEGSSPDEAIEIRI